MTVLKEACGVFGVYDFGHAPIYPYIYWGLISQNHRGHQSHGLLTHDDDFRAHRALGLVPRMKSRKMRKWIRRLPGHVGIGNVRYATSGRMDGASLYKDIQPTVAEARNVKIAISYNGNIVNVAKVRAEISQTINLVATSDTELLSNKLCLELAECGDLSQAVKRCLREVEGAYSTAGITHDGELFAFRDPLGIKPLCIGFSEDKRVVAISSESVGLAINDLHHFLVPVNPGELVRVTDNGVRRDQLIPVRRTALCSFEFAYFARPDSILNGTEKYVYAIRRSFGRNLGRMCKENREVMGLDTIIPVPETANDAAYGFHEETGLPLEPALRRHRYVTDRAFITVQKERGGLLNKKLNVLGNMVSGKRIALIDDSIVRGDTTRSVVQKMRAAGAEAIYIYITFPKIISPCFYGIDMATFSELIGTKYTSAEIASILKADGVIYQRLEDFMESIGLTESELCLACVTGQYPTPLAQAMAEVNQKQYEEGIQENRRIYERTTEL